MTGHGYLLPWWHPRRCRARSRHGEGRCHLERGHRDLHAYPSGFDIRRFA